MPIAESIMDCGLFGGMIRDTHASDITKAWVVSFVYSRIAPLSALVTSFAYRAR